MTLRTALVEALHLLRDHPLLFVPRLAMTVVWSFFWLFLVRLLEQPYHVTLEHITLFSLFALVLMPLQIWVYNTYFVMVKRHEQQEAGEVPLLRSATRKSLKRLPQSMAVFALLGTMMLVFGTPGAIIYLYGLYSDMFLLQAAGVALSVIAVLAVILTSFFAPVSVVIGDRSFFRNVKDGILASHRERRSVIALTALSFTTLLLASSLQGRLEVLGILGFFAGRILAAVLGVYFLVVNPELFLYAVEE